MEGLQKEQRYFGLIQDQIIFNQSYELRKRINLPR
jgi:hypothetical protein